MPQHSANAALLHAPATRPAWLFLAATFGISWSLQLPAVLAQRGLIPGPVAAYLAPAGLGAFGPLFAALVAARSAGGGRARAVFRPLREWRINPGVAWALWHFPVFVLAGITPSTLPWMFPFFTAGSVVFTWLYNRGGLWLAVLAHTGAHLNNSHHALPENATPLLVHTAGYCLLALGILLFDRNAFDARRGAPAV